MRSALILGVTLFAAAGVFMFAVTKRTASTPVTKVSMPKPGGSATDPVAHGKYLVSIVGCADCHTPHDQTGATIDSLAFSGHPEKAPLPTWSPEMLKGNNLATIAPTLTAFAGPFGTSVAPNLTSDMETGLMGVMTLETFTQSMRSGMHWKGGRPILPPMPAPFYKNMTDEDLKAVFAYLKSVPPIKNKAPDSIFTPPPAGAAPAHPAAPTTPSGK